MRWAWLVMLGLLVQLMLFSDPLAGVVGDVGPPIYVASTASVLVAVLRDIRIPGMAVVAVGASSNLVAIVANGGYMPADPAALAAIGGIEPGFSNSSTVTDPALWPLTDIFALPAWLPLNNVFSVGDILLGIGISATIVPAMTVRAGANSTGV